MYGPNPTFNLGEQYYVPQMTMASILGADLVGLVSLGTPDAIDPDGILDAGALDNNTSAFSVTTKGTTAGPATIADYVASAKYGQCVAVKTATGTTARTVYVWGRDYLGQHMVEKVTTSATTGATVYTKKAFKAIDKFTGPQAAGAITIDVGWSARLGLPFKMLDLTRVKEGSEWLDNGAREHTVTAAVAGLNTGSVTFSVTAPITGYLIGVHGEITTAVTTNPAVMDATRNGSGIAAMDVTVPVAAAGFAFGSARRPTADWIAVTQGDALLWTSNNGPDAGAADFTAVFATEEGAIIMPDTTDPATDQTGDPRGIYQMYNTPDGAKEVLVKMVGDPTVNASNNGGLHGIQQVNVTS